MNRGAKLAAELADFFGVHRVPEGERAGQFITLNPWQIRFLADTFQPGIRRSILSIARRNGKTLTVAGIACALLYGPLWQAGTRFIAASRTRHQARILFKYASKMIEHSGFGHLVTIKPSAGEIIGLEREGMAAPEFIAIAAEASAAVGLGGAIVCHDELGQVRGPHDPLYDSLTSAQGEFSNPLEIIISTQAPADGDLFNMLIDDAQHDDATHLSLYAAPDDCDPLDPDAWRAANPSIGGHLTDTDISTHARRAARSPALLAGFRNYRLNQRVAVDAAMFDRKTWEECDHEIDLEVFRTSDNVVAGLDLAQRTDLASLVLLAEDEDGWVHCLPFAWTPLATLLSREQTDRAPYSTWIESGHLLGIAGRVMNMQHLAQRVVAELERYDVVRCNYDRWRIHEFVTEVEQIAGGRLAANYEDTDRAVLHPCGQGFRDMGPAVDALEELVIDGRLRHGGHPVLTMAVANTVISEDPAGNRKPVKNKSTGRIDPLVALCMAAKALTDRKAPKGITHTSGIYVSDG